MPGMSPAQILSPGPLHKTHAKWEGDDKCSTCHSEGKRVSEALCLDCHTDLRARIQAKKGLHGKTYLGKECVSCHIDHLGKNGRLTRWPGKNRNNFRHQDAGWRLRDSHAKIGCDKCHTNKNSRGNKTYLGLNKDCATCHDDPHEKRFGKDCATCHAETTWQDKTIDNFDHDLARFVLNGKHQTVGCDQCHGQPPRWQGFSFSGCDSCHKDPHKGRFRKQTCQSCHVETSWSRVDDFAAKHPIVSLKNGHSKVACAECHDRGNIRTPSKGSTCVACHPNVHTAKFGNNCKLCHASIRWLGLPEKIGRDNHGKTRYPLEGKHRTTKCVECHSKTKPPAKRYRNLAFNRCLDCHADTHKGSFIKRDKGECAQCHSVDGFWPTSFGIELHATTKFPLEGKHIVTPCNHCHKSKRPRATFTIPKQQCVDCHKNPHGNQFDKEMKKGGCATCHTVAGWNRPNIDHSIWPLTGAHAKAECDSCHTPSAQDRKSGTGVTYRGVPRDCESCHKDIHAGQFRLSKPVKGCDFCHGDANFKIPKFDHTDRAGYTLTGEHLPLECSACHKPEKLRDGSTSTRYRLGYRQCKDCHANPHTRKR